MCYILVDVLSALALKISNIPDDREQTLIVPWCLDIQYDASHQEDALLPNLVT